MTSGHEAGTLLSVNVGLPQDVTWHGRTVRTAVWKKPVTGPRIVRRLNIDGDGQGDLAGHGYSRDPVDDPADGDVLICCSQPRDDLVLDL